MYIENKRKDWDDYTVDFLGVLVVGGWLVGWPNWMITVKVSVMGSSEHHVPLIEINFSLFLFSYIVC